MASTKKIALEFLININNAELTVEQLNEKLSETKLAMDGIKNKSSAAFIELANGVQRVETELGKQSDVVKGVDGTVESLNTNLQATGDVVGNTSASFKTLTKDFKLGETAIQGISQVTGVSQKNIRGAASAVKMFGLSLKGMSKALIATGIGALVVALGLIVAYWEDIKGLVNGVSVAQQKNLRIAKENVTAAQEQLAATEATEATLTLQGLSEADILELKRAQTDEAIAALEIALIAEKENKEASVKAATRNKSLLAGVFKFINIPLTVLMSVIDQVTAALEYFGVIEKKTSILKDSTTAAANAIFNPDKTKEEGDAVISETEKTLAALTNKRDGFILKQQKNDKKQGEKSKKERDKEAKDKAKGEEKAAKEKAEALEAIRKGQIDTEAEKLQEELDAIDRHYTELIAKAEKYGKDTSELEKARETKKLEIFDREKERETKAAEEKATKELAVQEKLVEALAFKQEEDALNFEQQRELVNQRELALKDDKTLNEEQRLELEKNFAKQRENIDIAENQSRLDRAQERLQMAGSILGSLSALTTAFAKDDEKSQKKAFKINKAFGIGQAIISTAGAVIGAINPATGGLGIPAGLPGAAIAAATGIAQIATISKTQFGGGGNITTTPPPSLGGGDVGTQPRGFTSPTTNIDLPTTKVIVTETDIRDVTRNVDGVYSRAVVVQ